MSKISTRMILFLVALLWAGIGLAQIAIRGELQVDHFFGLFVFEIAQFFNIPKPIGFTWYVSIAIFIHVLFFSCLWQLTRSNIRPLRMWVLLTIQLLIVILYMKALPVVLTTELLLLTWRQAWKCLVLILVLCASVAYHFSTPTDTPFDFAIAIYHIFNMGDQALPFVIGSVLLKEKRIRIKLQTALRELETNQALLLESIKVEERLRVETNLHDVIGHQLAALNQQLDLVLRHTQEKRSDEVQSALAIARESGSLLLSQIRAASRDLV